MDDRAPLVKIVVFCPNLIGDTVMATPAIRVLRHAYPDAKILAVIKPHVAPTLNGSPWFDEVVHFSPKSKDRGQRMWGVIQRLRRERADLVVLFPNSYRSALMAWLSGIPSRIGYGQGGRGILLTKSLASPRNRRGKRLPSPIVDSYLDIVRALGCSVDSVRLELFTTPEDESAADRAWEELNLNDRSQVVCLNTGGAFGPAKSWPVEYFAKLAKQLAQDPEVGVLVICGPSEREAANAIVAQADHPHVVSLANQPLSIGLSKASVRRASLLITTDSGPRHFAAAFKVPVLSLFGPTNIAWTRTYHPHALHLYRPVPCGPCQRPECPLGHHRCMRELLPETVYQAARRFL